MKPLRSFSLSPIERGYREGISTLNLSLNISKLSNLCQTALVDRPVVNYYLLCYLYYTAYVSLVSNTSVIVTGLQIILHIYTLLAYPLYFLPTSSVLGTLYGCTDDKYLMALQQ